MSHDKYGILLVISGPSGVGKSSLCAEIRRIKSELHFSVSCTTRKPRPGEKDGVDYFFISEDEFKKKAENGDFLEHAKVHSNLYGTLKSQTLLDLENGRDVLLDIDVQGAAQIKSKSASDEVLAKCLETVFIAPPSFAELESRLRLRGTEPASVIDQRLADAKKEMDFWNKYDYLVVNAALEDAARDMLELISVLRKKTCRMKKAIFL